MTQKQVARKRAITSGRIVAGEVVAGEIVTTPKTPSDPIADAFSTKKWWRFDAKGWNDSRRAYGIDVAVILRKIDTARERLGIVTKLSEDEKIRRWAIAAEPTGAYPVVVPQD